MLRKSIEEFLPCVKIKEKLSKNDSLTLKSNNQLYGCRWGGHLPYFKVVISHFQNESEVVLIYMHTASNLAKQEKFLTMYCALYQKDSKTQCQFPQFLFLFQ